MTYLELNHKPEVNDHIRAMLTKRGFYVIGDTSVPGSYCLVEVEEDGTVHQLTPEGKRDGVLSKDGWHDTATANGPFVTVGDTEKFITQQGETS